MSAACCTAVSVTTLPLLVTEVLEPPTLIVSGAIAAPLPPARPSNWLRIPVRTPRPAPELLPLTELSNPPMIEQAPVVSLPAATLLPTSGTPPRRPFAAPRRPWRVESRPELFEPPVVFAADTPEQMPETEDRFATPMKFCSTLVRLRLTDTLARLPVPVAVGLPLASSEADA